MNREYLDKIYKFIDDNRDNIVEDLVRVCRIESVTQKCQLVASCAAVGREDKLRGEKVVVFIVAKESASERQIKKELSSIYKKNLAKYEIPREIRFIDALPQTKLAKVDFKALEKL